MKLQISFDLLELDKALAIANEISPYADIVEIGSLLIYKYGIHAITEFRRTLPTTPLLADVKTADRGRETVELMASAGADWITVMGATNKAVIHSACTMARKINKKIMLDLMDEESPGQRTMEAKALGSHAILFHRPHDAQASLEFLDQWDMIRGNTDLPIFVSAKFDQIIAAEVAKLQPDGIVVGPAITEDPDPVTQAKFYHELCHGK
ncbi:orotidine 5'-phosphate decarboxylase [Candidatus Dependentiae bacterium]|nr:orotidine 5'-phosphate decarboxylase [Candidatus Dependentiae bacterium]